MRTSLLSSNSFCAQCEIGYIGTKYKYKYNHFNHFNVGENLLFDTKIKSKYSRNFINKYSVMCTFSFYIVCVFSFQYFSEHAPHIMSANCAWQGLIS